MGAERNTTSGQAWGVVGWVLDRDGQVGADLRHAVLIGANLCGGDLRCSFLAGAVLMGADLTYADLTDTELEGTDVTGIGTVGESLETN